MKKVIVSVINDLSTDQRVNRTCLTLTKLGFDVLLIGRQQKNSLSLSIREYKTKRMRLLFEKGVLFYAEYNIRLFLFLLPKKASVLVSNDLDTLIPSFIISKLKKSVLVYDTHEIFTEVPELQHNHFKRNLWARLEKFVFPKLKYVYTVNDSIAKYYRDRYSVPVMTVKNIPITKKYLQKKTRAELGLPVDKKIVLLQGAGINMNRGAEEALEAMEYIDNAILLIIGGGDVIKKLKEMAIEKRLQKKVRFIDKIPFDELKHYTMLADIGLAIDKDTNINYRYSLPNKLFDYIHAGIPVLSSPLVEIKKIFDRYHIGELIENHSPQHIAYKINLMLSSEEKIKLWRNNAKIASTELNWENEEHNLIKVFKQFV